MRIRAQKKGMKKKEQGDRTTREFQDLKEKNILQELFQTQQLQKDQKDSTSKAKFVELEIQIEVQDYIIIQLEANKWIELNKILDEACIQKEMYLRKEHEIIKDIEKETLAKKGKED